MKKIPLRNKIGEIVAYTLVDNKEFILVNKWKWHLTDSGYVSRNYWIKNVCFKISLHRFLLSPPKGKEVDHKNNNRLDNQRKNLRICTRFENQRNYKKQKNNTSGFKGVTWHKKMKKWVAQIQSKFIKAFDSKEEAALAYDKRAKKLFGKFAKLNFPK